MYKSYLLVLLLTFSVWSFAATAAEPDMSNVVYMETDAGRITIQLFPDKAPNHVARIKELIKEGFYKDISFHRVIKDYIAVTGIPSPSHKARSDKPNLKFEASGIAHKRGVVSMAREIGPDSANSQFFIVLKDAADLDGKYSAFGQVIAGLEVLDKINPGNPAKSDYADNPTSISDISIASDAQKPKADAGAK